MIRLIVGLGNPDTEYERTRHNVGFWWIDGAARKLGATLKPERAYHGLLARVNRPAGPLFLLEPQTYMNLSGKSVASLARFFKIAPSEMLVVHDEIDLPPGQMKLKLGGGVAGHNGLKDVQAQLGSADFWRLRIGVGHPGSRDEVADWVLCKPSPEQREAIESCVQRSLDALNQLIDGPMERAMMKIHAKPKAAPRARVMTRTARCVAAALLTATALGALAQERVYRCGADGRSYSQEPCAAGHSVAVDDARSAQQVAQARLAARRDAQLAETLAREREQRERQGLQRTAGGIGSSTTPRERPRASSSKGGRDKPAQVTLYRAAQSR